MRALETWVIVVAAGAGERLGSDRPKAFVKFGERTLVAACLETFEFHEGIDGIVVAVPEGFETDMSLIADDIGAGKIAAAVPGGASRAESVANALACLPDSAHFVLVHDAARPLVDDALITRVMHGLAEGADGVVPALAVTDTVKRLGPDGTVSETFDRSSLRAVQTPQGFPVGAASGGHRPSRRIAGGRHRLRVAGRGRRRPGGLRRGRPAQPQGHDAGGSRPGAGAGRVIVDYHLHLRPDGSRLDAGAYAPEHLAQYVATARERGVGEIAITEHIYRFAQASHLSDHVYWREQAVDDIELYCSSVAAARDSGLPILLGIELDWLGLGAADARARDRRRLRVGRRARLRPLVGAARVRPSRLLHLGDAAGRRGLARSTSTPSAPRPRAASST